jgi:hypothetical protein
MLACWKESYKHKKSFCPKMGVKKRGRYEESIKDFKQRISRTAP